jgi:hypothetical protein
MRNLCRFLIIPAVLLAQDLPAPHPLFERDEVHEVHLRFSQSGWYEQLLANFEENEEDVPYIEAAFQWRDVKFDSVGVRLKGNSTARVNSVKKPFRIKFNEFVKGQKIDGIGAINLNNFNMDPSMVREKPYFELAAAAGLKAARMSYAALYLNNEYWGLYFLGEVVNDDFIKQHFPKAERGGCLYKGDIGSTFEDLGDIKEPYKRTFEKKTFEDEDDWSDLIALIAVLNRTPKEELLARIEPLLDLDSFLTAMALDNLTVNLDSYVGMSQNFYIYRRPTDNRFVWIPWDPSLAFGAFNSGLSIEGMKLLPLEWTATSRTFPGGLPGEPPGLQPPGGLPPGGGIGAPMGGGARPLATKLWEVPQIRDRYTTIYRRLVREVYKVDDLVARMIILRALIRPWVERDKNKLHTLEQFDNAMTQDSTLGPPDRPQGGGGQGGTPALEPFLRGRLAAVLELLNQR